MKKLAINISYFVNMEIRLVKMSPFVSQRIYRKSNLLIDLIVFDSKTLHFSGHILS